ncbi:FAD-binding oxidoreductase [Paeniglutamicibacter sp. NPDC012692]|uniref:FAD-binding oxidoreductase n=1 Tax=Paeniglutamicibacter sp. NPDC012692 TaxID=3364388 RepID=UPI0036A0BF5A
MTRTKPEAGIMDTTHPLPASALRSLSASLHGMLITGADPEYGEARSVWNAMIDRHPILVVRAADVADVCLALAFARDHRLPLAIRAGGHNVAGFGTVEHGLVLDLRALNTVHVDPAGQQVRTGGGTLLGELDRATSVHGLAVPVGVISQTGVAGLCLGGGLGWLTRPHGLTVDNLLAADLVTAEGEVLHTDASTNPELLWGLTGGGGNFGVVTDFTFKAHPLPETLYSGNLIYRVEHWKQALRALRDWALALPDPMTVIVSVLVPPADWDLGTKSILVVGFLWADPDHAAGVACVEDFTAKAPPDEQEVSPASWPAWQSSMDALFPKGVRAYWKNSAFDALSDDAIEVLVAHATQLDWPGTAFDIHVMGGAMGRVPLGATAFPDRSSPFWLNIYGFWNDSNRDAHHVAFIRGFHREMQRFSSGGEYTNFSSSDDHFPRGFDALGVFGEEKLARLTALKDRYDPNNLLRLNHNIVPPRAEG